MPLFSSQSTATTSHKLLNLNRQPFRLPAFLQNAAMTGALEFLAARFPLFRPLPVPANTSVSREQHPHPDLVVRMSQAVVQYGQRIARHSLRLHTAPELFLTDSLIGSPFASRTLYLSLPA